MLLTKLEINFIRLLKRCEEMARDLENDNWRFETYVKSLQSMLVELKQTANNKPSSEKLKEYSKSVEFLKSLLASKQLKVEERCIAANLFSSSQSNKTSSLQLEKKSQFENDVRQQLFNNNKVRNRKQNQSDTQTILREQIAVQDSIVDDMLGFTSNLKRQANAAKDIIKTDVAKVGDSYKTADSNYGGLKTESERLQVHVNKSACSCTMWIMLFLVAITFIGTVLFMRIFHKRKQ